MGAQDHRTSAGRLHPLTRWCLNGTPLSIEIVARALLIGVPLAR
jgi:hypothetical protein